MGGGGGGGRLEERVHCNADTFWRQQKCPVYGQACTSSVSAHPPFITENTTRSHPLKGGCSKATTKNYYSICQSPATMI